MGDPAGPGTLGISDGAWATFVERVRAGYVVPIIGSRLLSPPAPERERLAESWAEETQFPLAGTTNLPLVAQYAEWRSTDPDDFFQRAQAARDRLQPNFDGTPELDRDHPVRLLAELPFEHYVTTSYSGLLADAIRTYRPGGASPEEISCLWNPEERAYDIDEVTEHYAGVPTRAAPFVLHLIGRMRDPASLVITELHHMQFTDRLASVRGEVRGATAIMPTASLKALANSSWLFLGYSAADLNFRSLLRAFGDLVSTTANRRRQVVAVQLLKEDALPGREQEADDFLSSYFGRLLSRADNEVEVLFGEAGPFLRALRDAVLSDADGRR